jgi:glycosyltransferase involved in cell wall biosynthesis
MNGPQPRPDISFIGLTQRISTEPFGGAPVVIVNLANHFVRRGFAVEVLVFAGKDVTELPFPFEPEVRVHLLRLESRPVLLLRIVRHLLRSRPRVMTAVGNKADMLVALATYLPRIQAPFWPSLHHNLSAEMEGWSQSKRGRRVRQWRRILGRAAGLICVSQGVADDFLKVTGCPTNRVKVLYNPIVTPGMANDAAKNPAHPWFNDSGPPVVLALGRLTDQKDFPTLLCAFEKVRRARACRLLILGEGERRPELERLVSELELGASVDLPGFEPDRLRYLLHARLLVLSSVWEGLPTVLIEALALGTPIVATDCPSGPRELLAGGEYGRLVPMRDPDALADAMLESLEEEPDRRKLRTRARDFSVERGADRYLETMGLLAPDSPSRDV